MDQEQAQQKAIQTYFSDEEAANAPTSSDGSLQAALKGTQAQLAGNQTAALKEISRLPSLYGKGPASAPSA